MENDTPNEQIEIKAKGVAQADKQASQAAVIAALFLIIGIMIGAFGYSILVQNQADLVEEIVANQLAGQEERIANEVVTTLLGNAGDRQPQAPQAPGSGSRREVDPDDDPAIGSPDAPIVMIEFSDFRCQYCGRFASTTLEPLLDEYGEYIYFVYRDFAILGPESVNAAVASECADEQGQFWNYHDLLFANQQVLGRDAYISFAGDVGLNVDAFTGCIDNETYLEEVQLDTSTAQGLGATGTPTFFINGRYVSGAQPFDVFAGIIEEELAAAGIEVD